MTTATSWPSCPPLPVDDFRFVTRSPIAVGDLVAAVAQEELGGTTVFLGSVRRGEEDGPVSRIEYSAYEEMLEAEFGRIVSETAQRWVGVRIVAQHRLGSIPVGDASIAIAVASPHRAQAFEACRHVIEEAKVRLPVWKREIMDDGSSLWTDNTGGRVPGWPVGGAE